MGLYLKGDDSIEVAGAKEREESEVWGREGESHSRSVRKGGQRVVPVVDVPVHAEQENKRKCVKKESKNPAAKKRKHRKSRLKIFRTRS